VTDRFDCQTSAGPRSREGPAQRTTVPAGTVIVGRYTIWAGSKPPSPGQVKLVGYGPSGQSRPSALSGP
jgi:hypothetical protein